MYDDFKLKKPFGLHGLYTNNSALYHFVEAYLQRSRSSKYLSNVKKVT